MTDTFTEFERLRDKNRRRNEGVRQERDRKAAALDAERDRLLGQVRTNLMPFHAKEVDGHALAVADKGDRLELRVDTKLVAVFSIKRHSYHYSCENICDHEPSHWHTLEVLEKRKKPVQADYGAYFAWTGGQNENFALAMVVFLENLFMEIRLGYFGE